MTNINELIGEIRQWGEAKGITGASGKGTLLGQLNKTQEELTETRDAAVMFANGCEYMLNKKGELVSVKNELQDGIGDAIVTLILAPEMAGLHFEDCLQAAYDEIKNRTGEMVGGVFIKDK